MESLQQIIGMHIKECDARDARNASSFTEIKQMSKGIWDTIDGLKRWVYMGLGIAITLPTLIELLHFLREK